MYEREVGDMEREFWELHFIPLALCMILGNLLDELSKFEESKALGMRIRGRIESTVGADHPYYIISTISVAMSHIKLGEWMEAQSLQEKAIKYTESTHGTQSSTTLAIRNNLALTHTEQGR